ncbi:hypothetical protein ACFDTO_16360 [Microbacteriaceae bacterium 4G12]
MDMLRNERDNILQVQAAQSLGNAKKDIRVHNQSQIAISPTGTMSAAGEIATGELGGLSFDELIGEDIIGNDASLEEKEKKS